MSTPNPNGIGAAVTRKEDRRFITGAGNYTDDIVQPGQKYAVFVRSPHAHADILSIDAEPAKRLPGVAAVLIGNDVKVVTTSLVVGVKAPMAAALRPCRRICVAMVTAAKGARRYRPFRCSRPSRSACAGRPGTGGRGTGSVPVTAATRRRSFIVTTGMRWTLGRSSPGRSGS